MGPKSFSTLSFPISMGEDSSAALRDICLPRSIRCICMTFGKNLSLDLGHSNQRREGTYYCMGTRETNKRRNILLLKNKTRKGRKLRTVFAINPFCLKLTYPTVAPFLHGKHPHLMYDTQVSCIYLSAFTFFYGYLVRLIANTVQSFCTMPHS